MSRLSPMYHRDEREIPFKFTVSTVEGEPDPHDGIPQELIVIKIGSYEIWRENHEGDLYWDEWGDGGPSLEEAVIDIIGQQFMQLRDIAIVGKQYMRMREVTDTRKGR